MVSVKASVDFTRVSFILIIREAELQIILVTSVDMNDIIWVAHIARNEPNRQICLSIILFYKIQKKMNPITFLTDYAPEWSCKMNWSKCFDSNIKNQFSHMNNSWRHILVSDEEFNWIQSLTPLQLD